MLNLDLALRKHTISLIAFSLRSDKITQRVRDHQDHLKKSFAGKTGAIDQSPNENVWNIARSLTCIGNLVKIAFCAISRD